MDRRMEKARKPDRPPLPPRWHDVFRVAPGRTCAVGTRPLLLGGWRSTVDPDHVCLCLIYGHGSFPCSDAVAAAAAAGAVTTVVGKAGPQATPHVRRCTSPNGRTALKVEGVR